MLLLHTRQKNQQLQHLLKKQLLQLNQKNLKISKRKKISLKMNPKANQNYLRRNRKRLLKKRIN